MSILHSNDLQRLLTHFLNRGFAVYITQDHGGRYTLELIEKLKQKSVIYKNGVDVLSLAMQAIKDMEGANNGEKE